MQIKYSSDIATSKWLRLCKAVICNNKIFIAYRNITMCEGKEEDDEEEEGTY